MSLGQLIKVCASYQALLLAIFLTLASQWLFLSMSTVAQEGSKQVVREKRIWARTPGKFKKAPGQELVLVFGNSTVGAGFVPEVFDKLTGHKTLSYNMALIGLQLPPHYFLLKDFIKHNGAPDWILLQYSTGGFQIQSFPGYAVQGANFFEVLTYAHHRKNFDVFLNYIIPSRLHWPEVTRYIFSKALKLMPQTVRDHHKEIYLNKSNAGSIYGHNRKHFYESQYVAPESFYEKTQQDLEKNRGYYWIIEQAAEGGVISKDYLYRLGTWKDKKITKVVYDSEEFTSFLRTAVSLQKEFLKERAESSSLEPFPVLVDDFFQLTQKHHIKVMIIDSYALSKTGEQPDTFDKKVKVPLELRRLQKAYNNIYFPLEKKASLLLGLESFSDPGHANYTGAEKYTTILAEEFKALENSLRDNRIK